MKASQYRHYRIFETPVVGDFVLPSHAVLLCAGNGEAGRDDKVGREAQQSAIYSFISTFSVTHRLSSDRAAFLGR